MGTLGNGLSRAVAGAAVLCALVVWLAPAGAASASAFPGSNGKLVFAEESATTSAIAAAASSGGGVQTLTTPPSGYTDSRPRFSADGNWIVFERFGFASGDSAGDHVAHLMVMRADGSCQSDVSSSALSGTSLSDSGPSFAPDGSYIVFARFDQQATAYTGVFKETLSLNCSGGSIAPGAVTPLTTAQDSGPTVSPDGSHIAFDRVNTTSGLTFVATAPVANPSSVTPLSNPPNSAFVGDAVPDYSPDGSKIVFSRDFDSLYVVNANGSGSATPLVASSSPGADNPAYSPDGSRVIFKRRDAGVGPGGSPPDGLYTVPAAGGTPTEIAPLAGTSSVAWSNPDWGVAPAGSSLLRVDFVFSCPSSGAPCGAPYPPHQPPQPGAGRVLGLPSTPGAGKNFDCWGPAPPPGFTELGGFLETCSLPVSPGQTLDLSAYATTYGSGKCSLLFCPGTGWPPWKVTGLSSSVNVSGCTGPGATCDARMGSGLNVVTVTLVPADLKPNVPPPGWALKGIAGYPWADSTCKRVSGHVNESTCTRPWNFAGGASDLDHDPHLSYTWDWGDGTVNNCPAGVRWAYLCVGDAMAHAYADPGRYTITQTVTDSDGQTVSSTAQITVYPDPYASTITYSKPLGSPVASAPSTGGGVSSSFALTKSASTVSATVGVTSAGGTRVHRLVLSTIVKHNVAPGAVVLRLKPHDKKLLAQIRSELHRTHKHTLRATLTIVAKFASGKTAKVVQHIKLRF